MDCGLQALKVTGASFTWSRDKGPNMILERHDKSLAMNNWFDLFPFSYEKHLIVSTLDHVPLLLHINDQTKSLSKIRRPFRFENMWVADEDCQRVVSKCWNGSTFGNFVELAVTVKKCGHLLTK